MLAALIFGAIVAGIPLWLVLRAWLRYLTTTTDGKLLQMRIGLTLVSATTLMWIAVVALMYAQDYSQGAKSLARNVSPAVLGMANLALCLSAFACCGFDRKQSRGAGPLRRAIGINSAYLALAWLVLLANPH